MEKQQSGQRRLKLGIIDSGLGGDLVKERILNKYNVEVIQYKPPFFFPYGDLHTSDLFVQADTHINYLNQHNVDIVIVACMTLSVNCLSFIKYKSNTKKVYDLYTSLPYINYNDTIVLATKKTVETNKFKDMVQIPCGHLANAVENKLSTQLIKGLLRGFIHSYDLEDRKSLLIGCSHYSLIKEELKEVLQIENIYDPNDYLLNKLEKKLNKCIKQ